jgi:hypothetical protein
MSITLAEKHDAEARMRVADALVKETARAEATAAARAYMLEKPE